MRGSDTAATPGPSAAPSGTLSPKPVATPLSGMMVAGSMEQAPEKTRMMTGRMRVNPTRKPTVPPRRRPRANVPLPWASVSINPNTQESSRAGTSAQSWLRRAPWAPERDASAGA